MLLIQMLRYVIEQRLVGGRLMAGRADARLHRALAAVHAEPARAWTLSSMAAVAGMSRARFASRVGVPPGEYLTAWRLGLARTLLRRGLPVKQVAIDVSDANASALGRVPAQPLRPVHRRREQLVRTSEPPGGSMRPMPMSPPHLLVIEDEQDIAALLRLHLSDLPARVDVIPDGPSGLAAALREPFDVIVLDLRLPGLSGLDICRELRAHGRRVPVLMLTARAAELDRVLGLELGADDYVTKPFSVLELKARVRALLRRAAPAAAPADAPSRLASAELSIDRTRRRAWLGSLELVLTPREFDLLWHFMGHPGRAFTRAELLEQVWGYGHDGYDHTVNSHINRLRAKLGDDRSESRFIHTVWGVGYRFEVAEAS